MDRKTIKPIVVSMLSALAFGAVGTAGTFALFTDKAEAQIQISAGIVNVESKIEIESVYELGGVAVSASEGVYTSSIGAKTEVDAANTAVTLSRWTPGDKASFILTTKNLSNVDTLTRLLVSHTSTSNPDLFEALDIKYEMIESISGIGNELFRWKHIPASANSETGEQITKIRVTIEFRNIGEEITTRVEGINNQFQESNCKIVFTQQAVQGNAHIDDYVAGLNTILAGSAQVNSNLSDAIAETMATAAELDSNDVVYSPSEDRFYYQAEVSGGDEYKYVKVFEHMPLVPKWSVYAAGNSWASNIKLEGIGFDAGSLAGELNIQYVGGAAARENYIRTNNASQNVTINAPLDTVHHYGTAGSLNIIAVAGSSYHEHGKVAFAEIAKGRIALEEASEVGQIHVSSKKDNTGATTNTFESITIAKATSVEMPTLTRDDVEIASQGTLVVAIQEGTDEVTEQTDLDYVWLTKQGVFEQIKISDSAESANTANTVWADQAESDDTQNAAQQIANNIGRDNEGKVNEPVEVAGTAATIVLDDSRDLIVVTNVENPSETKMTGEAAEAAVAEKVVETGLNEEKKEEAAETAVTIAVVEEEAKENVTMVARIGKNVYASLEAAFEVVKAGETIVLLNNATSDSNNDGYLVDKNIALNTNGNTVVVNTGSKYNSSRAFKVAEDVKFDVYGGGTIDAKGTENAGCFGTFRAEKGATLTLKDLKLKNYRGNGLSVKILGASATLDNVEMTSEYGGGIEVTDDQGCDGTVPGYAKLTNVVIKQDKYHDWCSTAVSVSGKSVVDVHSSEFEGEYGAYVFSSGGIINIYGGKWTASNSYKVFMAQTDTNTYPGATSAINVYGGDFYGAASIGNASTLSIHDGTFSFDPTAYIVGGKIAYALGEGRYGIKKAEAHLEGNVLTQSFVDANAGKEIILPEGEVFIEERTKYKVVLPDDTDLVGAVDANGNPATLIRVGKASTAHLGNKTDDKGNYVTGNNVQLWFASKTRLANLVISDFDLTDGGDRVRPETFAGSQVTYENIVVDISVPPEGSAANVLEAAETTYMKGVRIANSNCNCALLANSGKAVKYIEIDGCDFSETYRKNTLLIRAVAAGAKIIVKNSKMSNESYNLQLFESVKFESVEFTGSSSMRLWCNAVYADCVISTSRTLELYAGETIMNNVKYGETLITATNIVQVTGLTDHRNPGDSYSLVIDGVQSYPFE